MKQTKKNQKPADKPAYSAPTLTVYGAIKQLTTAGSKGSTEFLSTGCGDPAVPGTSEGWKVGNVLDYLKENT